MKKRNRWTGLLAIAAIVTGSSLYAEEVLAKVNGVAITKAEADSMVHARQAGQGLSFDTLPAQGKQAVVKNLIERALIRQAAQKAGIDQNADFKQALQRARNDLLVTFWLKKQYDDTIVSDGEAKEFYEKNKDKFKIPERVHARHILVKTKEEAQKIIDQLKGLKGDALKKKFIELAKAKSTGPTGPKGGDLGFFTPGQMVKPFSDAAFSLDAGQITTKPVQTQFGWHVIYVEEKKPAKIIPFEQAKPKIIQILKQKHFSEKIKKELDQMKKKAKIEYEDPSLKAPASPSKS
ncbi:peptidylprolyl isomerase [Nitratifractor sp.]